MYFEQLLKDYSKIIQTMSKVYGDFRFKEQQEILLEFVQKENPIQNEYLHKFLQVFKNAESHISSLEDCRIFSLIITVLYEYFNQEITTTIEKSRMEYIQKQLIPEINLHYAKTEKNFITLEILELLAKKDEQVFLKKCPQFKQTKKQKLNVNLDDTADARSGMRENIKGLMMIIQKELIATYEEMIVLEEQYCQQNEIYSPKLQIYDPPIKHELWNLLIMYEQKEKQCSTTSSFQNQKYFSNLKTPNDDLDIMNITFELENPLLTPYYNEGSKEEQQDLFSVFNFESIDFDFCSELANFESCDEICQRIAVLTLQGQVLLGLEKIIITVQNGLPQSYQSAILRLIKVLSGLVNYSYYYSYTRDQKGIVNQLISLQSGPFYQDLQMLIQRLNDQLLNINLELWQKLFMPSQRGYICTQFTIISNCISVIYTLSQALRLDGGRAPGENTMRVKLFAGLPYNATEPPINLNKESVPIFLSQECLPVYRPYFTKQTVNALVIGVQVLVQQLVSFTLQSRYQIIQMVYPEHILYEQFAKELKSFRFSDTFLKLAVDFQCESFSFVQIERQFQQLLVQQFNKQRSSPSRQSIDQSSLSTNSIVHYQQKSTQQAKSKFAEFSLVDQPKIEDFEPIKFIARGGYGVIILVNYKVSGTKLAMKIMKRSDIVRKNQVGRIKTEKQILQNIEQTTNSQLKDFVVKFYGSFKSSCYLFLLLEYMQFGDLSQMLGSCGAFSEEIARFYIAEIAIGLQLMHARGIIYNDCKPENLMITEKGHIKFTDFGISSLLINALQPSQIDQQLQKIEEAYSQISSSDNILEYENTTIMSQQQEQQQEQARTIKIVGTPCYLAPEILKGGKPSPASDFFSLGVCMYEFLYGCKPFDGATPQEVFTASIENEPEYFDEVSEDAIELLKNLLQKNPSKRITTLQQLADSPFFKGFNFYDLQQHDGPFLPTVKFEGEQLIEVKGDNWIDDVLRASGLIQESSDIVGTQSDDNFSGYSFYKDKGEKGLGNE